MFNHDPNPFAFWITRRSTGEIIFDTRASSIPTYTDNFSQNGKTQNGSAMPAHPLVFEDQYLQLATAIPDSAYIYGLGEWIDPNGFARTKNGSLTTHWARDAGDPGERDECSTGDRLTTERDLQSTRTHMEAITSIYPLHGTTTRPLPLPTESSC